MVSIGYLTDFSVYIHFMSIFVQSECRRYNLQNNCIAPYINRDIYTLLSIRIIRLILKAFSITLSFFFKKSLYSVHTLS